MLEDIKTKMIKNFQKNKLTFFYIVGIAIAYIGGWYLKWEILTIIGLIILIIVALIDFLRVFFILIQSNKVKIITAFFAYFIYGFAELISKEIIYEIVNAFPDTFNTAIYFLNFGFIILIWLVLIVLLGCIFYAFAFVLSLFKNISYLNNKINNILSYFANKLEFESRFHMVLFFYIGLYIIFVLVSYPLQFQFKYAEHIVFLTSYQKNQTPNGDKICSLVADDKYIHLLGDNRVSIAPYYFLLFGSF